MLNVLFFAAQRVLQGSCYLTQNWLHITGSQVDICQVFLGLNCFSSMDIGSWMTASTGFPLCLKHHVIYSIEPRLLICGFWWCIPTHTYTVCERDILRTTETLFLALTLVLVCLPWAWLSWIATFMWFFLHCERFLFLGFYRHSGHCSGYTIRKWKSSSAIDRGWNYTDIDLEWL